MPRIESLTGLRWWAAFFVFSHHMTNLAPLPIAPLLRYGTSGVTFFFVLSGFVLTWSAQPGTLARTFYRRRFARIWPAHALTLMAAVLVFYRIHPDPAMHWIKPLDLGVLLLALCLLQGWSYDPTILYAGNPVSWTLSVEAFFYFYAPYVQRATARLKATGGLVLCVVAIGLGCAYHLSRFHWRDTVPILPQPVIQSVAFLFGIGSAIALRSGLRPRIPFWATLILFASGICTLLYASRHAATFPLATTMGILQFEILTVLYGLMIVAVASRDLRDRPSLLRSKPLVTLGQWSFCFYLVHSPILYTILELHGKAAPGWSNLGWYTVVLTLSLITSWLLHQFVERPLERRLRAPRPVTHRRSRPSPPRWRSRRWRSASSGSRDR
ncbi:acyltransferase [Kribbella sp. NBC_00382]|uniref:acyltransferase family protein n=1 Tax=Kribbella sp. NBC_00382 TaxID=2975967 RepID=UPI002E1D666C